jgi:hypothetical protein
MYNTKMIFFIEETLILEPTSIKTVQKKKANSVLDLIMFYFYALYAMSNDFLIF